MYGVILAGGGGTRLWPLSRRSRPKPFLPLLGDETLFQRTLARLPPLIERESIYVVADEQHLPLAREQAPWLGDDQLIGEPIGRNTAAAIALAALTIDRPTDEVMAVLPADHRITDEEGFRRALSLAAGAAADGSLVTLGITPTGPETGYGYIVPDDFAITGDVAHTGVVADTGEVRRAGRFIEKPSRERAEELLAGGPVWWNAGIFLWRRDAVLAGLERHAPEVIRPLREGLPARLSIAEIYESLPAISIDYALLEPASLVDGVRVVPADVGWSDSGSWTALRQELARESSADDRDVVAVGRSEDLDSVELLVHSSSGRLVVTVGLRGTIVVDTPDVVLVCDADRAQDVRRIVDRLSEAGQTEHL